VLHALKVGEVTLLWGACNTGCVCVCGCVYVCTHMCMYVCARMCAHTNVYAWCVVGVCMYGALQQ